MFDTFIEEAKLSEFNSLFWKNFWGYFNAKDKHGFQSEYYVAVNVITKTDMSPILRKTLIDWKMQHELKSKAPAIIIPGQ